MSTFYLEFNNQIKIHCRKLVTNNCRDFFSQLNTWNNRNIDYMLTYILNKDCSIKDIKITPKTKENEYACFIKDERND